MSSCSSTSVKPAHRRRVLIIGIDGVRVDCLSASVAPTLLSLKSDHTVPANAKTSYLTISAPGWASCLTGQWPYRTMAFDNDFKDYPSLRHPTVMHRLVSSGRQCHVVSSWDGITDHIAAGYCYYEDDEKATHHVEQLIHHIYHTPKSSVIADVTLPTLPSLPHHIPQFISTDPDCIFLHLDGPDCCGHEHGFVPDEHRYIEAIRTADGQVKRLLDAIQSHATVMTDEWLVMVTTDHGGGGQWRDDHGDNTPCVRNIFLWAATNMTAAVSEDSKSTTTTKPTKSWWTPVKVSNTAEIVDCSVAALHHLQLETLPSLMKSELDGQLLTSYDVPHADRNDYQIWWDENGEPLDSPPPVLPPTASSTILPPVVAVAQSPN